MKRIATVLAAIALLAAPAMAAAQTIDPQADLAPQAQTLVEAENAEHLKGLKRVFIPSFQVHFVTESKASAQINGIQVITGAPSNVTIKLTGVEDARMQALADGLYARTVQQLTDAGIEVVPLEQLKAHPAFAELAASGQPAPKEEDASAGKGKFFSTQGLPLHYLDEVGFIQKIVLFGKKPEDAFLPLGSKMGAAFSAGGVQMQEERLAKDLQAAALKVRITVLGGQLHVSNDFWTGKNISAVAAASFPPLVNRMAFVLPDGRKARLSLKEGVHSGQLGELVNVTSTASQAGDVARNVLSVALMLGGQRGIGYGRSQDFEWRADAPDFESVIASFQPGITRMFTLRLQELVK